jgi:lysophospholipase L1-like esterase
MVGALNMRSGYTFAMRQTSLRIWVILVALAATVVAPAVRLRAQTDQWAKDMAAFDEQDRTVPYPDGGVVFVGSSSIRRWDLKASFPDLNLLNRGFGGSQIVDSVHHVDLLVIRHKPRVVVFYAGDNDLTAGKTPRQVVDDFKAFVAKVHAGSPATRIAVISIKPSLARWKLIGQMREANAMIRELCLTDDKLGYIDVDAALLGWDETPRKELFVEDGLHMTPKGYAIWAALVRTYLDDR